MLLLRRVEINDFSVRAQQKRNKTDILADKRYIFRQITFIILFSYTGSDNEKEGILARTGKWMEEKPHKNKENLWIFIEIK